MLIPKVAEALCLRVSQFQCDLYVSCLGSIPQDADGRLVIFSLFLVVRISIPQRICPGLSVSLLTTTCFDRFCKCPWCDLLRTHLDFIQSTSVTWKFEKCFNLFSQRNFNRGSTPAAAADVDHNVSITGLPYGLRFRFWCHWTMINGATELTYVGR